VNIRAKSSVIGEIPANVVRVFIDNDLIRIPQPLAAVPNVVGRHAEVEPPKPKTPRTASFKVPDMARTESASEVSMLPRVIEVVVRITTARVMSDPSAIAVDVRSIRVAWLIAKIAVFLSRIRITSPLRCVRAGSEKSRSAARRLIVLFMRCLPG